MRKLLVKIASALGIYKFIVKKANKYIERKEAKAIKERGIDVLAKVDTMMRERNIKVFFCFGLLLGAYREKGFIPYDFDIDLGMLASERPDNLIDIFKENGFTFLKQSYIKSNGRITIDQFKYDGVPIDIYYYYDFDDQRIACSPPRKHEYKDWRTANETDGFPTFIFPVQRTEFEEVDFLGHKFYMAAKAESWLRDIYGEDFMTPVREWTEKTRKTCIIASPERQYRRVDL